MKLREFWNEPLIPPTDAELLAFAERLEKQAEAAGIKNPTEFVYGNAERGNISLSRRWLEEIYPDMYELRNSNQGECGNVDIHSMTDEEMDIYLSRPH